MLILEQKRSPHFTYPLQGVAEFLHYRVEGSLEVELMAPLVRVAMAADMVLSQLLLGL